MSAPPTKFNWLLFITVLFAPAVLTLIGELAKERQLAVVAALLGSLAAGVFCGIHLARHVGRSSAAEFWLGWLFWAVLVVVLGLRHPPPLDDLTPLNKTDWRLVAAAVVIMVLTFTPAPFGSVRL